jgi:antitoxin PrlF
MEREAKITSKGQITVPADIRRLLRLKQGDRVVFEARNDAVTLRRVQARDAFAKYAGRYREGRGKTREEINTELRELRGQ